MHLIIPKQIYGSKYGTTCHSISLLLCSTHALSHRPPFKKLTFFHKKIYIFLKHTILVTVYILGLHISFQLLFLSNTLLLPGWCEVHVAQPKRTINQFQSVQKKAGIKTLLSNIYCGFSIAADNMVGRKKIPRHIFSETKIFFTKIV